MHMDNLEYLSDEELRLRLLQYGFQNLPITQTTRKILIKKLRNAMSKEKTKVRGESSLATSFSSGEDSDTPGTSSSKTRGDNLRISGRPSMGRHRTVSPNASGGSNSSQHVSPLIWGGKNGSAEDSDEEDSRGFNGFSADELDRSSNGSNGSVTDFRKRLMALRSDTLVRNCDLKRPSVTIKPKSSYHVNDIVFHARQEPRLLTPIRSPRPFKVAISNLVNKLDECYGVKQTFVPCILLSILIGFFVLIAAMYLTISPNIESTLMTDATKFSLCQAENPLHVPSKTCIEGPEAAEGALELIKVVIGELQRRAELSKCSQSEHNNHIMTVRDLQDFVLGQKGAKSIDVLPTLHNAQYLVAQNPHWGIKNVDSEGKLLPDMASVVNLRGPGKSGLAILNPVLPFSCIIKNKMQKFFMIVFVLAFAAALGFVVTRVYRYVKSYKDARKEMVNNLVSDITNAVIEQATKEAEEAAIVVTHLRDKLIPLARRKELEWAWLEAVRFVEENESRIQFEVANRNGEDCRLMRWVDSASVGTASSSSAPNSYPSLLENRSVKSWQGPAFDKKSNKIKDPPTPCLKIRQMFDKYDANDASLKQVITDAILAKVGSGCRIYDVQIEKGSCCVYVRCASNADAGIVHDQINGWWFDNRLVSIKFLRLERYLVRFPNSLQGPACLQASSLASIANTPATPMHNGDADDDDDDDLND